MKKNMMIVAVAFVVMMAFVGCQPVVTPPAPEKVPVSGTFKNITNTAETISVYQLDGTGTYYNAADDIAVTPTMLMFGQDVLAMTIGSDTYFNMKYIGKASFNPSFHKAGGKDYHFVESSDAKIIAEEWNGSDSWITTSTTEDILTTVTVVAGEYTWL